MSHPILEVQDLDVVFRRRRSSLFGSSGEIRAVDGISLALDAGKTLGVVGESGSGKSTLARSVVGLVAPTAGRILFDGAPLEPGRPIGRDAHMVFQDPFSSLNPRLTVGSSIAEPILSHEPRLSRSDVDARVRELLSAVQLPSEVVDRRPQSMSGGQLQRVGIARAIAVRPRLVVADEPVSALDVSVQAQILNLFADLQAQLGVAYLFIGHNLAVVEHVADRIAVMFCGSLMEIGDAVAVIGTPRHPYTRSLVRAVPRIDASPGERTSAPRTSRPSGDGRTTGCPYAGRCPGATQRCLDERPLLRPVGADHLVACHHADDLPPFGQSDPARHGQVQAPPIPDHESTRKGHTL